MEETDKVAEFKQRLPISERELEELETKMQHASLKDTDAASLACTVKNYYTALMLNGFTQEQSLDLVKSTVHYLLR